MFDNPELSPTFIGCNHIMSAKRCYCFFATCVPMAGAVCNWCYLGSCLVDFSNDFCISTCQKPPMEDGIDWQQSEGLFLQALDAYPKLSPSSVEHKQWLGFYFDSIEQLSLKDDIS